MLGIPVDGQSHEACRVQCSKDGSSEVEFLEIVQSTEDLRIGPLYSLHNELASGREEIEWVNDSPTP